MEQTDAKNLMRMMDINKKVEDAVNSPAATAAIDAKFKEISSGDMFAMYMTISGVRPDDIKQGLVRPFILGMAKAIAPLVLEMFDPSRVVEPEMMRAHMDEMLEERLITLDAETVTQLMSDVMRQHLGWLVVYGNLFGAVIGVVCALIQWP